MQKFLNFPMETVGFLMGFDYQGVNHLVCHNCDIIDVFCDKRCDKITPYLEESSSRMS